METNNLAVTIKLKKNIQINHMVIDNELIMLGPDNISYRVNPVGAFIWSLLDRGELTVNEMANQIAKHYNIDQQRAIQDAYAFVEIMLNKKMLLIENTILKHENNTSS